MEKRKFRLRNGMIAVEDGRHLKIVDYNGLSVDDEIKNDGGRFYPVHSKKGLLGWAYGDEFDAIEEITEEPDTKQIWVARNPGGKRLFAFERKPEWIFEYKKDGQWHGGKWLELPSTWLENVTFKNSPRRVRSLCLHRKQ